MKRRTLLRGGAALTVVFAGGCALPVVPKRPAPTADDAAGWIRHADGRYTLRLPRAEMGQQIATGLRRIAAAELGIDEDRIAVELPSTAAISRVRATVGSDSVKDFALPLAQACATLRRALAEGRQGVLVVEPLPAAELRSLNTPLPPRRAPGVHLREIVTGAPLFAGDLRLPGQMYGRVLRAPTSPELPSQPLALDEAAARAVPGFVALVRDPLLRHGQAEGVGIVARTPGALDRIAQALAPRWSAPAVLPGAAEVDAALDPGPRLARGALRHAVRDDRIDAPDGRWDVDLAITLPAAAHAAIEPRCAVARWRDAGLELWTGTQDAFYQRDVLARRMDLDAARIAVQPMRVGGAFGGRTLCTVELEAAVLARAVRGTVKVQWTRAQEFAQAFHRPPSRHRVRVRLADGRIDSWWHAFTSSHILFTGAALPAWLQRITDIVGDDGVARGALPPYAARRLRVEYDTARLPFHTGPWRGLGAGSNLLAVESAVDEAARVAGQDPVAFRLAHLGDARLARVLQAAVRAAGGLAAPPGPGPGLRGRGVACGVYKGMSYAAAVAECTIDPASGAVRVTGLWCAHDCGRVIDADAVRAQTEGNLVWCIGMVLIEELRFDAGRVQAGQFGDAPIPRAADVPPLVVELVDGGDAPSGAGETAMVAGAGAIANALRAATGTRFQRFPVRAQDLRAALAARPVA
jgi:isoquinoline 1-oxidoreductase beta subunit